MLPCSYEFQIKYYQNGDYSEVQDITKKYEQSTIFCCFRFKCIGESKENFCQELETILQII